LDESNKRGCAEEFADSLEETQRTAKQARHDTIVLLNRRLEEASNNEKRMDLIFDIQQQQLEIHRGEFDNMKRNSLALDKLVSCGQQLLHFFQAESVSGATHADPKEKEPEEE